METDMVEELKAEVVLMNILKEYLKETEAGEEDLKMQFLAKLGTISDYLANKPSAKGTAGERYFYAGVAIIDILLQSGAVKKNGKTYSVVDAKAGIDAIIELGDEILRMYASDETTPEKIKKYGEDLRKKKKKKEVAEFIRLLKSKGEK